MTILELESLHFECLHTLIKVISKFKNVLNTIQVWIACVRMGWIHFARLVEHKSRLNCHPNQLQITCTLHNMFMNCMIAWVEISVLLSGEPQQQIGILHWTTTSYFSSEFCYFVGKEIRSSPHWPFCILHDIIHWYYWWLTLTPTS